MKNWLWITLVVLALMAFAPTCSIVASADDTSESLSPQWNLVTVQGETASAYAAKHPCVTVVWHYVKPFDLWIAFFPGEDAQVSTDFYMDYNHAYWVYCK